MQTESMWAGVKLERIEAILRDALPRTTPTRWCSGSAPELAVDPGADWEELAAENARLQVELERQAEADPLTGVRNRRRFFADLRRELESARRHEDVISLLVVDLDGLERINEAHGLRGRRRHPRRARRDVAPHRSRDGHGRPDRRRRLRP